MIEVPVVTPLTTPLETPIGATEVLLLSHVPPPISVRVVVEPEHIAVAPLMAAGFTVTIFVAAQPGPVV
jgi:hypothetical protein